MRKRILWLARSVGRDVELFSRRPKRVAVKAAPCTCGIRGCFLYGTRGGVQFEGDVIDSFCEPGLKDAGIVLEDGQLVKVTLEEVK